MKIAFCADVHLGNHKVHGGPVKVGINQRCRLVLDSLGVAYGLAMKHGCTMLVVNGDLFDISKPPPQLLAEVQQLIKQYPAIQTILTPGNHDMESAAPGDHALGPLRPVALVVEKPTKLALRQMKGAGVVELWVVPFQPGKAVEWLPPVLAELQGPPTSGSSASSARVLTLHLGLESEKTPPWLAGAHDSVSVELLQELVKRHALDAVYLGNWHHPEELLYHDDDRSATQPLRIVQIGALCPTGYDNEGLSFGTMAIYDSLKGKNCQTLRVPGPRFLKVGSLDALMALGQAADEELRIYVHARVEPAQVEEAERFIAEGVLNGFLAGGEVEADSTDAQVALRQAAGLARSAETVDEAIASFVASMPLPLAMDGLRAEVLARTKQYLGGAS